MPNHGYPDDDGSRTPSGQHDEGRQRNSCYDTRKFLIPSTQADYLRDNTKDNGRSDSSGDVHGPAWRGTHDGDSNAGGRFLPAAYPAGVPGSTV